MAKKHDLLSWMCMRKRSRWRRAAVRFDYWVQFRIGRRRFSGCCTARQTEDVVVKDGALLVREATASHRKDL
jgi:hypothetical protein